MDLPSFEPEPQRFRQALGHFATGVTVITGMHEGEPVGFACQAFAALSLEPPLVLFCPAKLSGTWPRIARTGEVGVNVLTADQRDLGRKFGVTAADKFDGLRWTPAGSGVPILDGVLAWAACTVETVHEAGDHFVVIARVTELGDCAPGDPLLFYRGRFTLSASPDGDAPPEVVDTLLAWPRYADWM
ncbi:MAG TPA: flavin reductase family protein [Streptosporangiaceae bacterium]|jgi:3-hydroxy-9,10-secoandrosta-1,3,5(10)-triene-9,17-dione monooxygenase reductase component|nr:flavin reductase family protein [Streptosporangiaceae bacterium]